MKKIIAVLLAVLLVLSLAACNTDNLAEYKKALEKTEQLTKGKLSGKFTTTIDYNTDELSSDEIRELSYFKSTVGSFNAVYDNEAEQGIYRNYVSLGGLGFDFDVYVNGDEIFMKIPIVEKYLRFNDLQSSSEVYNEDFGKKIVSEETTAAIAEKWVGLMKKDDVFKGKDIILTTPDGEVKTTEYTITLSDEQIKELVLDSAEILLQDENFKAFYDEHMSEVLENKKSFSEFVELLKEHINDYNVDSFKYTALVDIDGYIVSENMSFSVLSVDPDLPVRGIEYDLDIKNWDINKEQSFDFPVLTDENTLKTDEEEDVPYLIEDLFKNGN